MSRLTRGWAFSGGPPECYMVAKYTPLGMRWPLREPNAHGEHALVSSYRLAKALLRVVFIVCRMVALYQQELWEHEKVLLYCYMVAKSMPLGMHRPWASEWIRNLATGSVIFKPPV